MPTEQEKQWIAAWRLAGPKLQEIRDEELRNLDANAGFGFLGTTRPTAPESNGLAILQSWLMRLRVKELQRRLDSK